MECNICKTKKKNAGIKPLEGFGDKIYLCDECPSNPLRG